MIDIVNDPEVGATFAVLLIVRMNSSAELEGTVTVFVPGQACFRGELVTEAQA